MKNLDGEGRCCLMEVSWFGRSHAFCPCCLASFDVRSRRQIANSFYEERTPGVFVLRPAVAVREPEWDWGEV